MHCLAPGVHAPLQVPALQTFGHAALLTHLPVESHVCGVFPLHCLVPGTQLPEHVPPLQTYGQANELTHFPVLSQV